MLSYRPNIAQLIGCSFVVVTFLGLFGFLVWIGVDGKVTWAYFPILFLLPIGYSYVVPLFTWPISIEYDSSQQRLTLGYLLLPKRDIPREQVKTCDVCKVRQRELYNAYVLELHNGKTIILSDLNIERFPGRFAHDMRLSEMQELPTFLPGFRKLMHRSK